jgi:hypothetical protein
MQNVAKYIILVGLVLLLIGIIIYFFGDKLKWLGHLPGDMRIEKENLKIYFPIATMLIVSIIVSLVIKLFQLFK